MQRFIHSRSQRVLGLDIRAREVRLVVLRKSKHMHIVEQMEVIDLPFCAMKEGKIQALSQLAECIHHTVQRLQIENTPTVVALPVQSVISTRVQFLKKLSHDMRASLIEENLTHYFPGVAEALCYDYVILPSKDRSYDTALLVATRCDQLNDYVSLVARSGLIIKIADIDVYALVRALHITHAKTMPASSVEGILDLSIDSALLILFNSNDIVFHQQIDYGDSPVFYHTLKGAIHLACSTHHVVNLNKLYITGDIKYYFNKIDEMQAHLGVTIQCIDISEFLIFSPSIQNEKKYNFSAKMMVCIGLALRRMPPW